MTKIFLRSKLRVLFWVGAIFLSTASIALAADSEPIKVTEPVAAPKPETAQGPTVIRRRVTVLDEYNALPQGDVRNRVLFNVTYSFGAKRDYGLTVEVPYVQYHQGDAPDRVASDGLGDIRTFFIHPFATQGKFIHAYALESYFNTARTSALGQGSTTLLPSYALTYRHSKTLQLIGLAQYQFDIQRDDGEDAVRALHFRPFLILGFPNDFYSISEVKAVLDLEHDRRWSVTANAGLGRLLGEKKRWAIFGVVGGPLNEFARDVVQEYQFKAGVSYFF